MNASTPVPTTPNQNKTREGGELGFGFNFGSENQKVFKQNKDTAGKVSWCPIACFSESVGEHQEVFKVNHPIAVDIDCLQNRLSMGSK